METLVKPENATAGDRRVQDSTSVEADARKVLVELVLPKTSVRGHEKLDHDHVHAIMKAILQWLRCFGDPASRIARLKIRCHRGYDGPVWLGGEFETLVSGWV